MLKKLRRGLTTLCACITGVILCLMAVVSLRVSETQLSEQSELAFQNTVSTVMLRMRMEETLDWTWLSQTEASNGLLLHIEENGQPLMFAGTSASGMHREELVRLAQEMALNQYDVDVRLRPVSALEAREVVFRLTGGRGEKYLAAVTVLRTEQGFKSLTVLKNTREEETSVFLLRAVFGGIVLFGVLLLIAFSWWFSGRAVRPVAESQSRQSEFIAAASHELRAPLAVIRTSASALGYEANGDARRFVDAIERECARTGRLVDDLLVLANVDAKNWSMIKEPVEIDTLLRETAKDYLPMAEGRGQNLTVELPASGLPLLTGDELRIKQMLAILLDNALRYSPESGEILLRAGQHRRGIRIQVIDNGPGIADEHKPHVFERFYREDKSRTRKEHYGLGLSIAWEMARLHRGQISLQDTEGGGLTVNIDFPLKESK